MNSHATALTRLEFLIVLLLVTAMAVSLPPTLRTTGEQGRAGEDLNNLKNLGQAMTQYLDDHQGVMFSKAAPGQAVWPQELHRNYIKDWNSFRSPFDRPPPPAPKGM